MTHEDPLARAVAVLKDGARLPGGWSLRIGQDEAGRPEARLEAPPVRLELRGEGPLVLDTRPQAPALADGLRRALEHLGGSLGRGLGTPVAGAVERAPDASHTAAPAPAASRPDGAAEPLEGGVVYLVPGHLGDPADLAPRTLDVISQVDVVVLEIGPTRSFEAILERRGVSFGGAVEQVGGRRAEKEALLSRLLPVLDRGGTVAMFGADEGIPGFCDPGDELLGMLRDARSELVVRTLGGPSALGTALMAIDLPTTSFTFLGVLLAPHPPRIERLVEALRHLATAPHTTLLFTNGVTARAIVRRLGEGTDALVVDVAGAVDLTRPTERHLRGAVGDAATVQAFEALEDDAKVVLAMVSRWAEGAPERHRYRALPLSVV